MEDESERIFGWVVEVRDLDLEQVRGEGHKGHQVLFLRNGGDVFNDSIQDIVRQRSGCQPVMLCRLNHIFVVPDY